MNSEASSVIGRVELNVKMLPRCFSDPCFLNILGDILAPLKDIGNYITDFKWRQDFTQYVDREFAFI